MKIDNLEDILTSAAQDAIEGTLSNDDRVLLYRLALTVAGEEFYRIERTAGGTVSPEALLLLQQIALLCDEDVDADKLLGKTRELVDELAEEEPR